MIIYLIIIAVDLEDSNNYFIITDDSITNNNDYFINNVDGLIISIDE